MSAAPPDPSLPGRLREFHARLPLAGDPPNALLAPPANRLLYLAALLRDTSQPAPALTPDGWRAFLYRILQQTIPLDGRKKNNGRGHSETPPVTTIMR
jgi:hypothetical protein